MYSIEENILSAIQTQHGMQRNDLCNFVALRVMLTAMIPRCLISFACNILCNRRAYVMSFGWIQTAGRAPSNRRDTETQLDFKHTMHSRQALVAGLRSIQRANNTKTSDCVQCVVCTGDDITQRQMSLCLHAENRVDRTTHVFYTARLIRYSSFNIIKLARVLGFHFKCTGIFLVKINCRLRLTQIYTILISISVVSAIWNI